MAAADSKPAPAPEERHVAANTKVAGSSAGSGGTRNPMPPILPPRRCSLQDLPPELLVEIFASLPGTDLPSVAQTCTQFHRILHIDSIWRRRCQEEYGCRGNLQKLEMMMGVSWQELYAKLLHPYRHILGLWQSDNQPSGGLLGVAVHGVCIFGWTYVPLQKPSVYGSMKLKPTFRISLTERKQAVVKCYRIRKDGHGRKDGFSTQCHQLDHHRISDRSAQELETWLKGEWKWATGDILQKDRLRFVLRKSIRHRWLDNWAYHRIYFPPSQPGDLIRPGLFQGTHDAYSPSVALLSFHWKHARVTQITGDLQDPAGHQVLKIHLGRRIQLPRDFSECFDLIQEVHKQVIQERQQQQQREDRTGDGEGHGWLSPAQPSVGESPAAALAEQPVQFVLPAGMSSGIENYPRTCRMCFYGFSCRQRIPGVFVLFDEDHFGFIGLFPDCFSLYSRVQATFPKAEAPSPLAFQEMFGNIYSPPLPFSPW